MRSWPRKREGALSNWCAAPTVGAARRAARRVPRPHRVRWLLAPELHAGIARGKSAESIGVRSGNWLTLRQAQALLNAPNITISKGLRELPIIAVLLGCALCRPAVAALSDGRCSGGFTLEATGDTLRADAPELSVCACALRPCFIARLAGSRRGGGGGWDSHRPSTSRSGENRLKADLVAATDNGLPAPELAAGIARGKSAKSIGARHHRRAARLCARRSDVPQNAR